MEKRKSKNYNYITLFFIAVAVFLIVFASDKIAFVLSVFAPLVYGIVIAYLMDGIVRFFNKKLKMHRYLAIAVAFIIVIAVGFLGIYYTLPLLIKTVKDLINYITNLIVGHNTGLYVMVDSFAKYLNIDLNNFGTFDISKLDKSLIDTMNDVFQTVYGFVVGRITSIGSSVVTVITSVMLAIYMLIEKDELLIKAKRTLRAMVPEKYEDRVLGTFTMANFVFKKFILGKFIDSTIIGIMLYVLFLIFRIEYAGLFGLFLGIGNMIPYFGPLISSVPVLVILLIINPWHSLIALIIILVVQQLDGNVIGPKILSENIGVSAFWILLAVTVCGLAFGFAGMIFGVPLVVVIKSVVEDIVDMRLEGRRPLAEEIQTKEEAEVAEEDAEK